MDEEKDPFLEDEDEIVHFSQEEAVNKECHSAVPSSPILNTPNFGLKFNNAARRRKGFWASGSGVFPGSDYAPKLDQNQEYHKLRPTSPSESFVGSPVLQSDFFVPKTPANQVVHHGSLLRHDSDEDIFTSISSTARSQEIIPCALNALLDGPEQADLSWTSSMVTPSGNNATWHNLNAEENLNTEERKVLLPSADSNFIVKPRALFSPGLNDTADSLNVSSDIDCLQFLKGERTDKTPKLRGRRNSCGFKSFTESPLANNPAQDASPNQKGNGDCKEFSRGSPILSGSSEFKRSPNESTEVPQEEEDLFDNVEEPLSVTLASEQSSNKKNHSVAESTPNVARRIKSPPVEGTDSFTPHKNELGRAESFLGDISVSTLEAVCKAHESKDIGTPEKQTDTMRKRLLFSSNPVVANPDTAVFKVPEGMPKEKETSSIQENPAEDCIPDDSFMEHLATMNTSIFTDSLQPETKMQSIKTSVSHMKSFCYSIDKKSDHNPINEPNSVESQTLMKEILSSVLTLESSSNANIKTKCIKSSGDLIVFSQLQEEVKQMQTPEEEPLKSNTSEQVVRTHSLSGPSEHGDTTSNSGEFQLHSLLSTSEGFQTARGNSIKLSQEAISKGLNILKDAIVEKDVLPDGIREVVLSTTDLQQKDKNTSSVSPNSAEVKLESGDLIDVQAAEEVKQLLHGVDFNQWHEIEQPSICDSDIPELPTNLKSSSSPQSSNRYVHDTLKFDSTCPPCGFSTARGKNISVSEKNMAQAKLLLKECEEGVDDLISGETVGKKLKPGGPNTFKHAAAVGDKCFPASNKTVQNKDVKQENVEKTSHQMDRKRRFSATAKDGDFIIHNKKVCVERDNSALDPKLRIPHSRDVNFEGNLSNVAGTISCRRENEERDAISNSGTKVIDLGGGVKISESAMNFMNDLLDLPSQRKRPENFSAASGKVINISKQALVRAKDIFNDDFPADGITSFEKKDTKKSSDNIHTKVPYEDAVLCSSSSSKLPLCSGLTQPKEEIYKDSTTAFFTTASGKNLNVSRQALNKAKNLFDDLPDGFGEESLGTLEENVKSCHIPEVTGFSTASGKNVKISEKAVAEAEKLFADIPSESHQGASSSEPQSVKAKSSVEPHPVSCGEKPAGFSTASGRHVTVSKQAFDKVKSLFDDLPENIRLRLNNVENNTLSESVGFSTANGKQIDVSEQALNKVKGLFDDIPSELDSEVSSSSNKLTPKERIGSKRRQLSPIPVLCHEYTGIEKMSFSTASGKPVCVSKQSLNKVKGIFDDLSNDPTSEKSLSTPSVLFEEIQGEEYSSSSMGGFSTASGKTVNVSREALKKVKNLFDELPSDFNGNPATALKPSKYPDLQDNDERRATLSDKNLVNGFSTASGKTVSVSKESLNKVKGLFDADDIATMSSLECNEKYEKDCGKLKGTSGSSVHMVGFSTAGGKSVQISTEALRKAQNLFDELPTESPSALKENISSLKHDNFLGKGESKSVDFTNVSIPMAGFSTAGGRTVHVSEQALCKAKNLFEDLPSDSTNDSGESHNFSMPQRNLKTKIVTEDDSGVFTSHENTLTQSSSCETSKTSMVPMHRLSSAPHSCDANKENQRLYSKCNLNKSEASEIQKTSLTQEITASTAAFLADGEFFDEAEFSSTASKLMDTISTSPSMVTDRLSNLRPVLSSSSENKSEQAEPTSPILVKSDSIGQRRRSRRGRLSLSSNTGSRSGSPTFGSQANSNLSSQGSLCRPRLSLPSKSNLSSPLSKTVTTVEKSDAGEQNSAQSGNSSNSSNICHNRHPSRKLFENETTLSSAMPCGSNFDINEITPSKTESEITSIKSDNMPVMRHSHQTPLMRKVLTRNCGPQSSGFKTPYKSPTKEQLKRLPSSPARNPPEAKRRKPSTNLYVFHIYSSPCGSDKLNTRELRPEVAEMRRRAAEEQKQLVANHAEEKGELSKPCVGSWLAGKIHGEESHVKLIKLSEIGQPLIYPSKELLNIGLNASTVTVTAANSAEFRFSAWDYYSEDVCRENVAGLPVGDGALLVLDSQGTAGVEEIERSFLVSPGVDPSLVPSGWVKNHYRWLVWKLASVEWRFPHYFKKRCLSPHILMLQLKYRYDREVDRCERPALRRILEHDDSAAKRMVLCVAGILNRDSDQAGVGLELELTDGWYSLTASIDLDMQHRVRKGVITVGTKLIMHGAELINCSEGCSPLQVRPDVRLKLCSNSTRRARWHAKLGFQDNPGPMRVSLGSVLSSGGVVSCVSVYVARVYPLVFMEKTQERTIIRSQRAELKELSKSEKKRHQLAETVYSQVQAEIQKEQMKRKRPGMKVALKNLSKLTSGEELLEILENTSDPLSVQSMLSAEQKNIIEEHQRTKQEELRRDMEARVRLRLSENSSHERQVTPVLKVRLLSFDKQSCSAILSVWRPSEDVTSMFKEGQKLTIFGVAVNGLRCGELQLSANRSTRYHPDSSSDIKSDLLRTVLPLSSLTCLGVVPRFGELDIVGFVVRVSPAPQTSENTTHFQTAYICDGQQNIVALSFWEGLKEFGVEDLITPTSFIAASNLQCRAGAIVRAIPCVYASELSLFTTNPRQGYLQAAMQELRRSLPTDLKSFARACEERLDNLQSQRGSTPAVCPRTPDPTPLSNQAEQNHTTASLNAQDQTPTNAPGAAPIKAQRKLSMDLQFKTPSSLNSLSPAARLAKLEVYGEPPPVSPILLSNPRRSLRTQFKAPRRTDSPSVDCKKLDKPVSDQK